MLQDSSQNDPLFPEKLEDWFTWLQKITIQMQNAEDITQEKNSIELEIPNVVVELLRCIVYFPSMMGPVTVRQDKIKQCLETLQNNQDEILEFFKTLQSKPSIIILLMQKLGRPLPLPIKDLIRAMEEVALDTTSASADLRSALVTYLDLLNRQQLQLVTLMQASVEQVAKRNIAQQNDEGIKSFINEWVQEFEIQFVRVATEEANSKEIGALINASVRVLKELKQYRDRLGKDE